MTDIEKREQALAKLTIEEQILLGLIKKPDTPHKLIINYMIGDSKGYTTKNETISLDNPFLKPLLEALDKLDIPNGHWGLVLKEGSYKYNKEIGNITDFEYDLLLILTEYIYCFYDDDCVDYIDNFLIKYNYANSDQNLKYLEEFYGLIMEETEYSFLVYQGYDLK